MWHVMKIQSKINTHINVKHKHKYAYNIKDKKKQITTNKSMTKQSKKERLCKTTHPEGSYESHFLVSFLEYAGDDNFILYNAEGFIPTSYESFLESVFVKHSPTRTEK